MPGRGQFIYINPTSVGATKPSGLVARVSNTKPLPAGFDVCFVRFYYQLQGSKSGSLQLYTQSATSKFYFDSSVYVNACRYSFASIRLLDHKWALSNIYLRSKYYQAHFW